ncbi:MAG: zf-HC2 domain-containing protein [Oscillospiraceae bacterium]|nr:zf-HC2 domain-containing protein [Oscillospiraceae bacterium]
MKCEIINDLLPLYCDGLTSQVSNEEIEKHLDGCKECTAVYESMRAENKTDIPDTNIEPLKKVRRKNKLKIIAGFAAGFLVLGIMFAFMYVGVVPASS